MIFRIAGNKIKGETSGFLRTARIQGPDILTYQPGIQKFQRVAASGFLKSPECLYACIKRGLRGDEFLVSHERFPHEPIVAADLLFELLQFCRDLFFFSCHEWLSACD